MNRHLLKLFDEVIDGTLDDLTKRPPKIVALALLMMTVEHLLEIDKQKYKDGNVRSLLEDACKEALNITDGIYLEIPSNHKETIH